MEDLPAVWAGASACLSPSSEPPLPLGLSFVWRRITLAGRCLRPSHWWLPAKPAAWENVSSKCRKKGANVRRNVFINEQNIRVITMVNINSPKKLECKTYVLQSGNKQVDTQINSAHICNSGPLHKCRCPSKPSHSRAPWTQTDILQKRSKHLWSGLLSAVLVLPQCDSWACNNVMEPNRTGGGGGYDIFLLSPLFTTISVYVCVCVCDSVWERGFQQMTVNRCRGNIPPSIIIHTTRHTNIRPQSSEQIGDYYPCHQAGCLKSNVVTHAHSIRPLSETQKHKHSLIKKQAHTILML